MAAAGIPNGMMDSSGRVISMDEALAEALAANAEYVARRLADVAAAKQSR